MPCQFFNPMYLQSKCDSCGQLVVAICANSRKLHDHDHVCEKCHKKPSLLALFLLWLWT
jgi:hypothetical protein